MFTRLPAWRLATLSREDYEHAADWWPLVGLITGSTLAGAWLLASLVFPPMVALPLAIGARLLLTAAFHEDGLGDFGDGMGGGRTRDRVLEIMKDSYVGSYAVLGYIVYYLLLVGVCLSLPKSLLPGLLLTADVFGKWVSSLQVQLLPYARSSETSKTKIVYVRSRWLPLFLSATVALALPSLLIPRGLGWGFGLGLMVGLGLMAYIRKRIGGYTGDCCGAIFLLSELACLLGVLALAHTSGY